MIDLNDKETGRFIGTITEEQLQFLIDQLEEESLIDKDYYINLATLEMFEEKGIDQDLLRMLKNALGTRVDMELEWTKR